MYMLILKEIIFTCVIYDETVHHHIERDITNYYVTWFLLLFGKGYTYMFSSAWSDSNANFPFLR